MKKSFSLHESKEDLTILAELKFQLWSPFEVEFWSAAEKGCGFIPSVTLLFNAGFVFSSLDMEFGKQPPQFSKFFQNENVCDFWSDSHDVWSCIGGI